MSETAQQYNPDELSEIYAKLNKQDVEQFYAGYQWWSVRQRLVALQEETESLHRQIAENAELMQLFHPSAISLASMARLQASGVNDLDLLDRMLERGEDWLDRTMQRLDYCEQFESIIDDYTQWCQNALEGAYDWIDSIREAPAGDTLSSSEAASSETLAETTEELFLQKLASEQEEQSTSEETTLKQEDFSASPSEEPVATSEGPAILIEEPSTPLESAPGVEEPASSLDEAAIAEETLPSLEVTLSESQEEQVSQLSQAAEISSVSDTSVAVPTTQENVEPESLTSQPVEISPTSEAHVEATSASDISSGQPDQEELSTAVPGDAIPESPSEDASITAEPLPAVQEIAGEELLLTSTSDTSDTEVPAIEEYEILRFAQDDILTEPAPIEVSSTLDSEQPVTEEHEILSPSLRSRVNSAKDDTVEAEFDPAQEELAPVEGNDSSDVDQSALQEDSEDGFAVEEPSTVESPTYLEESLPYRMYPPDKQPGIEANVLENAEQSSEVTAPQRKRNFLRRLVEKMRRN